MLKPTPFTAVIVWLIYGLLLVPVLSPIDFRRALESEQETSQRVADKLHRLRVTLEKVDAMERPYDQDGSRALNRLNQALEMNASDKRNAIAARGEARGLMFQRVPLAMAGGLVLLLWTAQGSKGRKQVVGAQPAAV